MTKLCAVGGCNQPVDEEVSLVFCPVCELAYQQMLDQPIVEHAPTKKNAGWNVEIFKPEAK